MTRKTFDKKLLMDFSRVENNYKGLCGFPATIPQPYGKREIRYELHPLDDFDKSYFRCVPVDDNEILVRIESDLTRISGIRPLAKIDYVNCRIFFIQNRDDEQVRFEKPIRLTWLYFDRQFVTENLPNFF